MIKSLGIAKKVIRLIPGDAGAVLADVSSKCLGCPDICKLLLTTCVVNLFIQIKSVHLIGGKLLCTLNYPRILLKYVCLQSCTCRSLKHPSL